MVTKNTIGFGQGQAGVAFLKNGWSNPEPNSTWSQADTARLIVPVGDGVISDVTFTVRSLVSPKHPKQRVGIKINGVRAQSLSFDTNARHDIIIPIPKAVSKQLSKRKYLDIEFSFPDAISPRELGVSDDSRKLGLQLSSLEIEVSAKCDVGLPNVQSRESAMSIKRKPSLIISYGMPKSASTFAWSLLKEMLTISGAPVTTLSSVAKGNKSREDYLVGADDDRIKKIATEASGSSVVIKTHSSSDKFGDFRPYFDDVFVFVQYRDPREISLSLIDHGRRSRKLGIPDFAEAVDFDTTLRIIDNAFNCARSWMSFSGATKISYDDLCFNTDAAIERISQILRLDVNSSAVKEKFSDTSKIIQFNKGERDRWKREMTQEQSKSFLQRYPEYYEGDW
jgi:hypothetical protein